VNGPDSGSCPMTSCGCCSVKPSGSTCFQLVTSVGRYVSLMRKGVFVEWIRKGANNTAEVTLGNC
jgi:hypothetical protein